MFSMHVPAAIRWPALCGRGDTNTADPVMHRGRPAWFCSSVGDAGWSVVGYGGMGAVVGYHQPGKHAA